MDRFPFNFPGPDFCPLIGLFLIGGVIYVAIWAMMGGKDPDD
jgi:hypothetical protein